MQCIKAVYHRQNMDVILLSKKNHHKSKGINQNPIVYHKINFIASKVRSTKVHTDDSLDRLEGTIH